MSLESEMGSSPQEREIPREPFLSNPDKRVRAVSVVVYDLQGGPFPEKALRDLERAAEQVAEAYGLALSISKE